LTRQLTRGHVGQPYLMKLENKMDNRIKKWIESNLDFIEKYNKIILELKKSEEEVMLGKSKVGGMPHLPLDYDWPEYEGEPMTFFAQINLKDVSNFDVGLPEAGWLFFFIHFDVPGDYGSNWDSIPKTEKFKVLYFDGRKSELEEYYFPNALSNKLRFKQVGVRFQKKQMLPPGDEAIILKDQKLSKEDFEVLFDLKYFQRESNTKMLGYPIPIQSDVAYSWSRQHLKDFEFKEDEEVYKFAESNFNNFITLLEFNCDDDVHGWSGDGVFLEGVFKDFRRIGDQNFYFGILREDLDNLNFENALLVFQST